tara:strand:+ start:1283 stop:2188 length:906 start_codon:yes stop_codon:yes gene_type:complete
MHFLPIVAGISAVFLWGISFVAIKIVLPEMQLETMIFVRQLLGLMTVGTIVGIRRKFILPARNLVPSLIFTSFVGIILHQWVQARGMMTTTAIVSAWLSALSPMLIAVMSWIWLREKFMSKSLIWLLIAGFGAILISSGSWESLLLGNYGGSGAYMVAGSAFLWALYSIMLKKMLVNNDVSAITLIVLVLGFLMFIPIFVNVKGWLDFNSISLNGWLALLVLGVGSTGLASILYNYSLKNVSGVVAASLQYPEPLVAMLGASILLEESFTMSMCIGGLLILVSLRSIQILEIYDGGSKRAN